MAMGNSAGRSSGNRTAREARRRATQRERALIDPPMDDPEPELPRWMLTTRGERLVDWLFFGGFLVFCVLLAVIIAAWWGLL